MAEKLNNHGPELENNAEKLEAAGLEKRAELERKLEQAAEQSTTEDAESARHEALELATPHEAERQPSKPEKQSREADRPLRPTKKDLDASFKRTMSHIQKDMSPASRSFSKVIHSPVVEKVSNAVGSTIARPNLIIAGGLGTLILCSAVYLIAKRYGYVLSGFEAIGTFILGWCIGAIIEFARVGFANKRRR